MRLIDRHRYLVIVILVVMGVYLALFPRFLERLDPLTGDEPFYVMTAISLLRDLDLDESNNYTEVLVNNNGQVYSLYAFDQGLNPPDPFPRDWSGWPSPPRLVAAHEATTDREGLFTKHGVGLSILIALPYQLAERVGADLLIMILAALLAGQMFLLAREASAPEPVAAAVAIGLAIAMPIGPYAFLIFPAIPSALLLVYAVRRVSAATNHDWQWLLAGVAIGFLPWLHQRFAPTAVILAGIVLVKLGRSQRFRELALSLTPVALGGFALLTYNQWLYGVPLQRVDDHAGFNRLTGTINGGFGLLLDAQWGLWIAAPLMIIALAALPLWIEVNRNTALTAIAAVTPYLLIIAAYRVWWGEWGPPARYLVPIVPFAAGPLAAWLVRTSVLGRSVAVGLWFAGMILTVIGYQDPQRFYHHPDGVNNLMTRAGELIDVNLAGSLVAFQPFSEAPFSSRLWISLFAITVALVASYLIANNSLLWVRNLRSSKLRNALSRR